VIDAPELIALEKQFGAQNYAPLPLVLTKGEGVYVWDLEGKRYMDFMGAYSAVSHGHCHPRLIKTLIEQAKQLTVVSRAFYTDKLGPFLKLACEMTGMAQALPMNTGAEAVETALKAARKWACTVKGVPQNQAEIIACHGNFHGRTIAIVGMSSEPSYRAGFGPFPPGFKGVPYGDIASLEKAITPHTAAFIVEPIQCEGGIIMPPPGYLKAAHALCQKHQVLFICDEIQTGLGRTGKLLASEHEGIVPDALLLGKALGGGLLPVSLFLARQDVMAVFTPGDHGSTFGGNPLAAAVGFESLSVIQEENFVQRAATLGGALLERLKDLSHAGITEVRGKGLLIGLELDPSFCLARDFCLKLMAHGILSKDTHQTVVRLAPPLIITEEQIDVAFQAIQAVLAE
jgi:ornithine--oxo-acid transaminase